MTEPNDMARTSGEACLTSSDCWRAVSGAADRLLDECEAFVREVPDAVYTAPSSVLPGGTVGKHMRHLLDHYAAIVAGTAEGGVIEYDHRERDVPMEVDRREAQRALARLRGAITGMAEDAGRAVRVRVTVTGDGAEAEVASSLARELAFATHHAVHHQAMMRAIAGEFGVELEGSFGKAPSTIQHETAGAVRASGARSRMCTLSIIRWQPERSAGPNAHGVRIVVNRDESHDRPQAVAPRWRTMERAGAETVRAVWPTDPQAGGTWIAANEHGLTLCLLNRNPEPPLRLPARLTSRGAIIPRLIDAHDATEAVARVQDLELEMFAPFRMVAAWLEPDGRIGVRAVTWERTGLVRGEPTHEPVCFASSGLGDSRVLGRLDLFRESVVDEGATPEAQDRFHAHVWPGRRHLSVMMYRDDARTVAVTRVEMVRAHGAAKVHVVMHHQPVLDVAHSIPRARAALGTD